MKPYPTKIKLLNWSILYEVAKPRTIWWTNIKAPDTPNQRKDKIFCVERVWIRDYKVYVWQISIGRIKILIANIGKFTNEKVF